MSSLRLALKQSLEQSTSNAPDSDDNSKPSSPRQRGPGRPRKDKKKKKRRDEEYQFSDGEDAVERAAQKIQSQFKKKKKKPAEDGPEEQPKPLVEMERSVSSTQEPNPKASRRRSMHEGTVPPPRLELLQHSRSLPVKRARKQVKAGMRVKVCFLNEVSKNDKIVHKKRWFGGRVSKVSKEGSKIRVRYDDGTAEVAKYPDNDIVVDDQGNGSHAVDVDFFSPNTAEDPSEEEPGPPAQAPVPPSPIPEVARAEKSEEDATSKTKMPDHQDKPKDEVMEPSEKDEKAPSVERAVSPKEESSKPKEADSEKSSGLTISKPTSPVSKKRSLDSPMSEGAAKKSRVEPPVIEDTVEDTPKQKESENQKESPSDVPNVELKDKSESRAPTPEQEPQPQVVEPEAAVANLPDQDVQGGPTGDKEEPSEHKVIASIEISTPPEEAVKMAVDSKPSVTETQVSESSSEPKKVADVAKVDTAFPQQPQAAVLTSDHLPKGMDEPVPRSGRRAAQQANERIVSKQEVVIQDPNAKKKKKRGRKAEEESVLESLRWVQCEKCQKWRVVPDDAQIPEHWFCSDNKWDPKRASCEAPEQSPQQVTKEKAKERRKKKRRVQQATEEGALAELTDDGRLTPQPAGSGSPMPHGGDADPKTSGSSKKKVGINEGTDNLEAGAKARRGRPRRTSVPVKESSAEAENLEWVQCEKCNKWRKLPPYIASDDLPDVWTCDMNTWNPSSASCDAPEDKSEGQQELGINSGANKLTYRHLIFGNPGRNPKRSIPERTRAAESLFTAPCEEGEFPTVQYTNSSLFLPRSKVGLIEDKAKVRVLDMLTDSQLWDELNAAAEDRKRGAKKAMLGYPNLPKDVKEAVKDLFLNALSTRTLTGDEVFSEAMNRDWTNAPEGWIAAKSYCCVNTAIVALCELVKEGVLEVVQDKGPKWSNFEHWEPKYRRAKHCSPTVAQLWPVKASTSSNAATSEPISRCFKISKPWKKGGANQVHE